MMKELKAYEEIVDDLKKRGDCTGEADQEDAGLANLRQKRRSSPHRSDPMEDADKLKQVEEVLKTWNISTHKWRSSHAMVKINAIFAPAPAGK